MLWLGMSGRVGSGGVRSREKGTAQTAPGFSLKLT